MGKFARKLKSAAGATGKTVLALVLALSLSPLEVLAENASTQVPDVEESVIDESLVVTPETESAEDLSEEESNSAKDAEEPAVSDKNEDEKKDKEKNETSGSLYKDSVSDKKAAFIASDEGLEALSVEGAATKSESAAVKQLAQDTKLTSSQARERARGLFKTLSEKDSRGSQTDEEVRSGDGTDIDSITAAWITKDSVDNENSNLLYLKAPDDSDLSAVLRITYSLSGQHNYNAGDIVITIPENIFKIVMAVMRARW